ncbi:flagellar biosynthetic protein FliO [Croceicoccus hydrothermalis]|uniref:flagellar biosynthetic protein FliO n=1 Tax=Croceicoccus hydrothermalis TaxID=2867964 RepID=UPI001EFC26AA|nr:flagellar biosynthetic protein FliO [Croceicoccus hydrothermalis]
MGLYLLKLLILLPLLGGLIWGSLWLTKRMQQRLNAQNAAAGRSERAARLVETTMVSPGIRLAVVEFRGREILIGSTRHGLTRLAEVDAAPRADFARAVEEASMGGAGAGDERTNDHAIKDDRR